MKPFQPTPEQLEAIKSGATKLWIPLDLVSSIKAKTNEDFNAAQTLIINAMSPLQPGEQYFVQEESTAPAPGRFEHSVPAFMMQEEQSQYKFTATAVEVKQVQYVTMEEWQHVKEGLTVTESLSLWHDRQFPDQPYSSNPYGFLVDIQYG